jgi:hypothetical protein
MMRPKVTAGLTAKTREVVKYINERTGLNRGVIKHVLNELSDTVLHFNLMGRAVKFEELGTYYPAIAIDGTYESKHRLDSFIKSQLNVEHEFTGEVENRENIGKTPDELVELWNEAHPDDLVQE